MGFQPSSKLSTTNGWWAQLWRKRNVETYKASNEFNGTAPQPSSIEHLYSPRMVGEIKERKNGISNKQTVIWPNYLNYLVTITTKERRLAYTDIEISQHALIMPPPRIGGGGIKRWSASVVRLSVCLSVCLVSRTSALTRKPKGLGRRNFAQGYPRSHATPTPTSRSTGQKSRSRGGAYCGGHLAAQLVTLSFLTTFFNASRR